MGNKVTCTCGHSWNKSDSSKKDATVCHICGKDNEMENGGWLDKYEQGGMVLKQKTNDNYGKKDNPNDVEVSVGDDYVGLAYDTTGRNYSPAWGGQFAMGGTLPGATGHMYARYEEGGDVPGSLGFTYARTGDTPSEGPYAKKTLPSAQNGQEMQYYQEGLDWKPKNISRNGGWLDAYDVPKAEDGIIQDDRGQWDHEGKVTRISGGNITMRPDPITGKPLTQPLLGIADTGEEQMMYPGQDYEFEGAEYVTEYPKGKRPKKAKNGVNQADENSLVQLDQLTNFTNYNKPTKGGWLDKY